LRVLLGDGRAAPFCLSPGLEEAKHARRLGRAGGVAERPHGWRASRRLCVYRSESSLILSLRPAKTFGATLQGADLNCFFKEAGLESGAIENITCSATEAITYKCVNNRGKNPSASNKRTFQTTGSASGNFQADRNGNVVGSVTITHASAASLGFSCPSGQTVTLVSVVYSGVMITDNTSGASISIPGTFSFTNPSAP
jgi:hypothetical protein